MYRARPFLTLAMPRRKRGRSTFRRKRRFVRRRTRPSSFRRRRRVPLPIGGFGNKRMVKLRYSDLKEFDVPVGGSTFNIYRANSVFDPDETGAGHQPLGFDQWMLAYQTFTVIGCKMHVRIMGELVGDQSPVAVCILKTGTVADEALLNTLQTVREHPRHLASRIGYLGNASSFNSRSANLTATWSARKWFGKRFIVGSADHMGGQTTNPTTQAFLTVKAFSISGNNPNPIVILTQIDYLVILAEPRFLAQS